MTDIPMCIRHVSRQKAFLAGRGYELRDVPDSGECLHKSIYGKPCSGQRVDCEHYQAKPDLSTYRATGIQFFFLQRDGVSAAMRDAHQLAGQRIVVGDNYGMR